MTEHRDTLLDLLKRAESETKQSEAQIMLIHGPDKSDPIDLYWHLRLDVGGSICILSFRPEDVKVKRIEQWPQQPIGY